jgi:hypothetical protein
MKKYVFRFTVALITFAVGFISAGYLQNSLTTKEASDKSQEHIQGLKLLYPTSSKGKIEVRFKEYGQIENRPTLKFEIINFKTQPVKYWNQFENYLHPFVKFRGQEKEEWLCGTGAKEFEIKAGESLTVEFMADNIFYEYLEKKGNLQVGFNLKVDEKEYKKIWSDEFQFPEEVKKQIIANYPDWIKEQINKRK